MDVLNKSPDIYWMEVKAHIMLSRFFRFHVSGDIPDADYFDHMVEVAKECPHCQILCFTKKYEIVNDYIEFKNYPYLTELPENLHIIFSGWVGLDMVNPFRLPEAHVRYRDGSTTAADDAIECSGNCSECALTDVGCWTLKRKQQVIFDEH